MKFLISQTPIEMTGFRRSPVNVTATINTNVIACNEASLITFDCKELILILRVLNHATVSFNGFFKEE